eukprot:gene965-9872_t
MSGNGKSFCSGGDLVEITTAMTSNLIDSFNFVRNEYTLDRNLYHFSKEKPFIPIMNGYVMGGGSGLAFPGKYRIITENTVWSMPENSIGFYPDVGVPYYLSRMKNNFGLFLALTGRRLKSFDCLYFNIGTHFIESKKLKKFLRECEENPNEKIENILNQYSSQPNGKSEYIQHLNLISKCFNEDSVENIFKSLKNENTKFSLKLIEEMEKFSPTSLKVTFKFMKLVEKLTIDQGIDLQYNVSTKYFTISNDFIEGVRAKIVDKDFKPKWNPKSLEDTPDDYIDKFFHLWDHDFYQGHLNVSTNKRSKL